MYVMQGSPQRSIKGFLHMTPVITIDGPGGSGKGTVSKIIADQLHFNILDSGAMYRVLAYAALKNGIDLGDEDRLYDLGVSLNLTFTPVDDGVATVLDGEDISLRIRNEEVGGAASKIAALPKVRASLLERQRQFATAPGLVGDGRDLGTVVFPEAQLKVFLDASAEERARRRVKQMEQKGVNCDYGQILKEIQERDHRDRTRPVAPLVPASDALVVDSTSMTIPEVVETIMKEARARKLC